MDSEDKRPGTSGSHRSEESINEPGMSRRRMLSVSFEKIITAGGIVFAAVPLLLPKKIVAECTCEPCSSPNLCSEDLCEDPSDYCSNDECVWDLCGNHGCVIDGCLQHDCRMTDVCEDDDGCFGDDDCAGQSEDGDKCRDDSCYVSDACGNHTCVERDVCNVHECDETVDTCEDYDCDSGHLEE